MNRSRRKVLHHVLDELERLREPLDIPIATQILHQAQRDTEQMADEEQDSLDNRPESLMWSTTNDDMSQNISDLYDAAGDFEEAMDTCQKMTEYKYNSIKETIIHAVTLIRNSIHR